MLTIDIINPAVIRNIVSTKVKMMICLTESFLMLTFTYSNKQKDEFEEVNGCFEQNPKKG